MEVLWKHWQQGKSWLEANWPKFLARTELNSRMVPRWMALTISSWPLVTDPGIRFVQFRCASDTDQAVRDLKYTGQETDKCLKTELYRGLISLAAPESLAFVGRVLNPISITTMELQSRYLVELYSDKVKLPSYEVMRKQIDDQEKWTNKTRYNKEDVDVYLWTPYLDWLAEQIGCDVKDKLTWALWFRNRTLYNYIAKGPFSGHMFR